MEWFPGSPVPGVMERTECGLTFGVVRTVAGLVRIWHGDDVTIGSDELALIVASPSHDACDAALIMRRARGR